ncbi:Transglutaminase-like superfamily protein [Candidatus Burarchaeum australiense]|nr:Transglutaminase-like superfamily protein [Candidatus Burarchaeum australiense]
MANWNKFLSIILVLFLFGCCGSFPPASEQPSSVLPGHCTINWSDDSQETVAPGTCSETMNIDETYPYCNPSTLAIENNCDVCGCSSGYACKSGACVKALTPQQGCENSGSSWCNGQCYLPCSSGQNFECPLSGQPRCKQKPNNFTFTSYENTEPYYGAFCDKIDPYDLNVREAASDAIRKDPGSYSINQLFDIYDWVTTNIIYQNVPLAGIPYHPSQTLATKSGDCKNQAVLIASMVRAIGGTAKVVVDPSCEHAYAIVHFGPSGRDMDSFTQAVAAHYGSGVSVSYFTYDGGIWVIFDPAGGNYPGDTLAECSGNRELHFITSCLDCSNQYADAPYTFGDKCYSQCPSGTITASQYTCKPCPEGSYSCNNHCLTCDAGSYLGTDCMCYRYH